GKLEFNSSGDGNIYSAIYSVYGKDFANDMVAVKYSSYGIEIGGFVIKPLYAKSNRTFQNFFVNGRYVKSLICQVALESAYNNLLMTGKFPACILTISVKPSTVDVNIHPSKAEVRFSDEKKISDSVYFAVKNALLDTGLTYEFKLKNTDEIPAEPEKNFGSIFTKPEDIEKAEQKLSEQPAESNNISKIPFRYEENNIDVKRTVNKDVFIEPEEDTDIPEKLEGFSYINSTSFEHSEIPPVQEKLPEFKETEKKIHVIGEAFKNYIMAEADDNIIMIDKHAAHERVIFERLKNQNCRQYMQMILSENKILLSDEEFSEMETNSERLGNMGFLFDYSQKPYIILKGVPDFLKELDMEEIIPEIAENFIQCRHNPEAHAIDDILHTMACKSAIKANDTNDISELQKLAEIVYNDENIRHCPHGRPVMFTMTKNNIERQFRRKL
ncbi:MAG: DNA mismatch repair endonuclease MutL, partial [Ruminococcus sp.]|nr:DNA mismatch repair endonuclease MutL [Ruminococcus sp.]